MKREIQVILALMLIASMTGCTKPQKAVDSGPPVILNEYQHGLSKCLEIDKNKDGKADHWLIVCGDGTLGIRHVGNSDLDGDGRVDQISLLVAHSEYYREFLLSLGNDKQHGLAKMTNDTGWQRATKWWSGRWFNGPPQAQVIEEDDWLECYMDRNSDGTPDWWRSIKHDDGSLIENVDTDYDGRVDAIAIDLSSPRQRDRAAERPPRIILILKDMKRNVFYPVEDKGRTKWWDVYKDDNPVLKQERKNDKSNH